LQCAGFGMVVLTGSPSYLQFRVASSRPLSAGPATYGPWGLTHRFHYHTQTEYTVVRSVVISDRLLINQTGLAKHPIGLLTVHDTVTDKPL
jgi:hypothetical protein